MENDRKRITYLSCAWAVGYISGIRRFRNKHVDCQHNRFVGKGYRRKGMTELKNCPFCGGKAKITARQSGFHGVNFFGNKKISWTIYIKCNKCHSRGKPIKTDPIKLYKDNSRCAIGNFYSTEYWLGSGRGFMSATFTFKPYVDKAIEAWNRRTHENK